MERLRQSDLHSLLGFVADLCAICEFDSFDGFLRRLVDGSSHLIPNSRVIYCEMDPQRKTSHNYSKSSELITADAEHRWAQTMHAHPLMQHLLRTGESPTARISDFWTQRQLHNSVLYQECYRHVNIEDSLCIQISTSLPQVVGIAWQAERNLTGRELLLADLARPHIEQAWQNARIVDRMKRQLQMLVQGIDALGAGAILCGPQYEVRFINAEARRWLAGHFGAARQLDRRLPEQLLRWAREQDRYLEPNGDAPAVRRPLMRAAGGKRLTIRLFSQPGAKLFLLDEEAAPAEPRALQSLGLTARESEVLYWIARGKTNSEIATILGIRAATAKKHTEHILGKLGVETRTAAAALALAAQLPA
jgi:DNA-binding CsgD family transcriptional regulator